MPHCRISLSGDEQVFAFVQFLVNQFQFLNFDTHILIKMTMLNGETGLTGKDLEGHDFFNGDLLVGDKIIDNEYTERLGW